MPSSGRPMQLDCATPRPQRPLRGHWSKSFYPPSLVVTLSLIVGLSGEASYADEAPAPTPAASVTTPEPSPEPATKIAKAEAPKEAAKSVPASTNVDPRTSIVVARSTKVEPEPTPAEAPAPTPVAEPAVAASTAPPQPKREGLFGQVLGTIDNFYGSDSSGRAHDPQTGIGESTAATPRQPASNSPETKANREAVASRAGRPSAGQPETAGTSSDVPRWARGGLIGSLLGEEKETPQAPEGRVVQLPGSQSDRVARAQQQPRRKPVAEPRQPSDQASAQAAADKPGWMSRMMRPLTGKSEPATQQASTRPAEPHPATTQTAQRRQPAPQSSQRMANHQPAQRRTAQQPTQRTTSPQTAQYSQREQISQREQRPQPAPTVANNQPAVRRTQPTPQPARPVPRVTVAQTRPAPEPEVRRWPSMEPTVAVKFGHGRPIAPTQTQSQIAQSGSQPAAQDSDITPIAEEEVVANSPPATAPSAVADWSDIDVAQMFPSSAPATSQVAAAPVAQETQAPTDEVAANQWRPAGKPMVKPQAAPMAAVIDTNEPADSTMPAEMAAVEFASSVNKLGLAALVGKSQTQTAKQQSGDPQQGQRAPIDVASQPRTIR